MSTGVLYDAAPGPRTVARHRVYTVVTVLALLGLLAFAVKRLYDEGQFAYDLWEPFVTPVYVRAILVDGLLQTLMMAFTAILGAVVFGAAFGIGKLSDHGWVRWPCWAVVEFFRAIPVLLLMIFIWYGLGIENDGSSYWGVVIALTLYNGSVLAEVFRTGVNSVERGQREAAYSLGLRKTQVMAHVLVPQGVRAMLPAIISQLVVALKDTSLGFLITYEEFLHAGKLIAGNLDYGLPFIPVVMVISPVYIGMCMLLSWFANWVAKRERRSVKTEAVEVAPAEPATMLPGDTRT
jgi:glutamate transport system permease protein